MSTYELLRSAIRGRYQVFATYEGHVRAMCPHVLGLKRRRQHCLFYQFGGTSESAGLMVPGSSDNWRCLDIALLHDVTLRVGPWFTADNHARPSRCIDEVDVEVDRFFVGSMGMVR